MKKNNLLVSLAVTALVAVAGVGAFKFWRSKTSKAPSFEQIKSLESWEEQGAPDFEAKSDKDLPFKLSQFDDKKIVVHFWASWCGPCVQELPSLVKFAQNNKQNVVVAAISQDSDISQMKSFLQERQFESSENMIFIFDQSPRVSDLYRVRALPESFILSQNRKLKKKITGSIEWLNPDVQGFFNQP